MLSIEDATVIERTLIDRAAHARSPINGSIELTPICNMNCDMCYVRLSPAEVARQGRLRTVGEWIEIARQMRDAGTLFLLLTGGEPLTYPDFRRLYLEIRNLGMLVTINTNGTMIDEDWAAFFGENKPRRINITLYGPDEETYASLCHFPGGFARTINAICLLRSHGVEVRVSISVTPQNAPHVDRMITIVHELDAAVLVDTYMMPASRERSLPFDQQSRLTPEEAAAVRIRALKQEMSSGKFAQFVMESIWAAQHIPPDKEPSKMRCMAGSCSFTINWQGQMRPCVVMSQPSASALTQGFDKAWQYIRSEVDKITLSSRCSVCQLRTICRTCAASAYLETGRYDGTPEYMCRYAKMSLRLLIDEIRRKSASQDHKS